MSLAEASRVEDRHADRNVLAASHHRLSRLVVIFLICLFIPFSLSIGPAALSPTRIVLIVLLLPLMRYVLLGRAGPLLITDIAFGGLCLWVLVSMLHVQGGTQAVEYSVIFAVETLGGYLMGRCLIRNADAFLALSKVLFRIVLVLFPFVVLESVFGLDILLRAANAIIYSQERDMAAMRMGMHRAHATLNHPITFGFVIAAMLPFVYGVYAYGLRPAARLGRTGLVALTSMLSLSTGPLLMLALQTGLYMSNHVLRRLKERWFVLAVIALCVGLFELMTGTIVDFVIRNVAFNEGSASNRLRIFEWSLYNIRENPLYGIGTNDWVRLPGMVDSADMFWMVVGMRHGIPAGVLNLLAFAWLPLALMLRRMPTARLAAFKLAYIVAMLSCILVTWTVHVWGTPYVLYCFLLGCGAWMLDPRALSEARDQETARGQTT